MGHGNGRDIDESPFLITMKGNMTGARYCLASISLILCALTLPVNGATSAKPDLVVIFCDDLGYEDLGCYGNLRIKTPHREFYHANYAARQGNWKYVATKQGEELFDLATDFEEKHNLTESQPKKRAAMRGLLKKWDALNGVTNGLPALTK